MEIRDEILSSIQILVNKAVENLVRTDIEALVTNASGKYCTVVIDGTEYKVKNGTNIEFTVGNRCLVHCINGDFNKKIIIAKL